MTKKKKTKTVKKKRVIKRKLSQRDRIWKKFCNLSTLDQYYLIYDTCSLYDDFRERLKDAMTPDMSWDGESLDELEMEIDSIKSDHK